MRQLRKIVPSTALASTERNSKFEKQLTQHRGKGHAATTSSEKRKLAITNDMSVLKIEMCGN